MNMGRLAGIARRDRPRGPMQVIQQVNVTRELGVSGEYRGAIQPGKTGRRQISLLEAESWADAMAELGADVPWQERRANLLVSGIRLPREVGKVIAIGPSLRVEITCECDPCRRMEEVAPGLMTALMPDWRGGVLGRVISDGAIGVGDEVRIEQ